MADRTVIYDPELQLAAVIDTDTMRSLGPIGGGPNARAELTQFVETMPEAIWRLSTFDLAAAYMQFWGDNFAALYETPESGNQAPMEPPTRPSDNESRLAEHEASAAAGEPPPPAPADADMGSDTGEADTVAPGEPEPAPAVPETPEPVPPYEGPCFNCQGSGTVPGATEGTVATCNLCHGSGQLPAPATA